jgi:hypothetical protein
MNKVKLIRDAIPLPICELLSIEFQLIKDNMDLVNYDHSYKDPMCPGSFSWYAPLPFESLLEYLKPKIEDVMQMTLHPTYSYARIYTEGAFMEKHTDRRSSEIAVSCCIDKDSEWPLIFDIDGKENEVYMNVGDICVYKGMEVPHWRNEYQGNKQIQAFLMYVDVNGPYDYFKYDTRPMLAAPFSTVKQVVIDEMNGKVNDPQNY